MARVSDGAIVGSAIVKIVAEHGEHADLALFDYSTIHETSCSQRLAHNVNHIALGKLYRG